MDRLKTKAPRENPRKLLARKAPATARSDAGRAGLNRRLGGPSIDDRLRDRPSGSLPRVLSLRSSPPMLPRSAQDDRQGDGARATSGAAALLPHHLRAKNGVVVLSSQDDRKD